VNVAGRLAGVQDAIAIAAGLLMVAMGLGAAGVASPLRRLEARAGGRVVRFARGLLGSSGGLYPLGLVLGLLPCGLSWSMLLGAAATGSAAQGLLLALAFGAGTVPALLLVGGAAALLGARARGALYRAGGILVALLGALFVARGLGFHAPL
jgi:sulfite exporter TauE/SafE